MNTDYHPLQNWEATTTAAYSSLRETESTSATKEIKLTFDYSITAEPESTIFIREIISTTADTSLNWRHQLYELCFLWLYIDNRISINLCFPRNCINYCKYITKIKTLRASTQEISFTWEFTSRTENNSTSTLEATLTIA